MRNAGRDDERHRLVSTDDFRLPGPVCLRLTTIVPQIDLEMGRPDKAKEVGLIDVLVRPARNLWLGQRNVAHHRMKFGRDLIVTK